MAATSWRAALFHRRSSADFIVKIHSGAAANSLANTPMVDTTAARRIRATAWAHAQVNRRPGEAPARILTAQLDLDVLIHDRNAGIAARVALLSAEHLVERVKVGHALPSSSFTG